MNEQEKIQFEQKLKTLTDSQYLDFLNQLKIKSLTDKEVLELANSYGEVHEYIEPPAELEHTNQFVTCNEKGEIV